MTVLFVYDDSSLLHDTGNGHPESIGRISSIKDTLDGLQISWYAIASKVILINIDLMKVDWEK